MEPLSNTKVIFNGTDLSQNGYFRVFCNENDKFNIFAGNKGITTSKAMYSREDTVTGITMEPLSFSLTVSRVDNPFDDETCTKLFELLDVETYKPLSFGDNEMYFNVMPYVGSISELKLFLQNKGYVTIPFVCDASHGWIDREYSFTRDETSVAKPWTIVNPCNVKDYRGTYRVYPYMVITVPEDCTFISFGLSQEVNNDNNWFTLENITPNQTITIDNENKQMFSSAGGNLLKCMGDNARFFYLEEGTNIVYHRTLVGGNWVEKNSFFSADIYMSCPVMWDDSTVTT